MRTFEARDAYPITRRKRANELFGTSAPLQGACGTARIPRHMMEFGDEETSSQVGVVLPGESQWIETEE